jgi:diketogulonate reductase-like aldo/keto reductase
MHSFDPNVSHDETLGALDQLVRDGKVRYIGCSNYLASQLARAIGRSETLGLARFDSVQPRYNLLYRNCERELFPLCLEDGVGVIPYNPLAGGFLTGKHRPGAPTEGTRFTLGNAAQNYQNRYWNERDFSTVETLRAVAAEAGLSLAQLAVAWCLAQPGNHVADHRRQPTGAARRAGRGARSSTRRRPARAPRQAHHRLPSSSRTTLIVVVVRKPMRLAHLRPDELTAEQQQAL